MPDLTQLALYVAAALVLAVTPGPGLFYVAARTLAGGRAEGVASSFGTGLGGMVHVLAGSFGVSAVVLASAELFTALKLIGAVYLVWLGVHSLLAARRGHRVGLPAARALGAGGAFRQGLVSNLLNPKIAVFFTSLLPQFVAHQSLGSLLLLGTLFNAIGFVWLTVYALAAARGRAVLQRPRVRAWLDAVSGVVLVGLGVRLAIERRG